MIPIEIDGERLQVALADKADERAFGLMEVEDLGELDGMLFMYESPRFVTFTMRNTLIPLDIWFIDNTGFIVGTAEMEPCPEEPCVDYGSASEVLGALETPLGRFDFAIGDFVSNMPSG